MHPYPFKRFVFLALTTCAVIVYHFLAQGTVYEEERYDRLQPRQEARQRKRAVKALEQLGYQVTWEQVA